MNQSDVQHTLYLFKKLQDNLPPLVPSELVNSLQTAWRETQKKADISVEELEDIMIDTGRQIWPYRRAFEDIFTVYESELGHKWLSARVTPQIRKKLEYLLETGAEFGDIHSGASHDMFAHDERVELTAHLIDLKHDIRRHATQAILSHDKDRYQEKVAHYGKMVEEINELLEDMRQFAHEEAHERVAQDIHSHARAIDLQFAHLAPRVDIMEVRRLPEYYRGKHEERRFH